jgi:hypothetical protein
MQAIVSGLHAHLLDAATKSPPPPTPPRRKRGEGSPQHSMRVMPTISSAFEASLIDRHRNHRRCALPSTRLRWGGVGGGGPWRICESHSRARGEVKRSVICNRPVREGEGKQEMQQSPVFISNSPPACGRASPQHPIRVMRSISACIGWPQAGRGSAPSSFTPPR